MADVFISFAPEDRGWVSGLAASLQAAGLDVLWDLAPGLGQAVQHDVEAELANAKAIIAVWSNASRNSNWVRDVAQEASDRGVLLPVLKDIDRPPLGFRQLRCADLRDWTGGPEGLDEVIGQLRERVGLAPAAPSAPNGDEQDFERSTIILKSRVIDHSVGNAPSQGTPSQGVSTGSVSNAPSASTAPSSSAKLVTAFSPGRAGPGDLRPGDEIGQYRVVRRLGAGGFGAVYEAANIHNEDERVALKLLLADIAESERFAQLLKLEANALLRLKHPAVVQYRVFGRIADTDQFYLVTEFVPGPTLRDWRKAHTPTVDEARTLAMRLAQGLAAAHRRGIVHRDLAPDNVIVTSDDLSEATLIDFGIARLAEGDALGGAFAGKFSYAAPEQFDADGGRLGPSIDIYAFGLLIAAFVRGKPIDMGRDMEAARAKRATVPPLDDIPLPLRPVLTKLLQPEPADRPQTMDEVSQLFDRVGQVDLPVLPGGGDPLDLPVDASVLVEGQGNAKPEASTSVAVSVPSLVVANAVRAEEAKAAEPPETSVEKSLWVPAPESSASVATPVSPPPVSTTPAAPPPAAPPRRPEVVIADRPVTANDDDEPVRRRRFGTVPQLVAIAFLGAIATFMLWPRPEAPPTGPVAEVPVPKPEPQPQPKPPEPVPTPPVPEPQPEPKPPEPQPEPTPQPEPEPKPPEPQPEPKPPEPQPEPEPTPPVPEPEPEPKPPEPQPEPEPEPEPEPPTASGQIEPAAAGTNAQRQNGTSYGKENKDARIIYVARRETTLKVVTGAKRNKLAIDKTLKKGDSYRLPNTTELSVSASDAGALDVILDGNFIGRAGKDGHRLVDFQATPVSYGGPAAAPKPPEPEPKPPEPKPPEPVPEPPKPQPEPPKPPVVTAEDAASVQAAGLAALNAIRAAKGAPPLKSNAKLQGIAAQIVAGHAAANSFVPPTTSQLLQMLIASGYGNTQGYATRTRKKKSVQLAFSEYWVNDPNVLSGNWVAMGVAMARASDGTPYYELVLGAAP